MELDPVSVCRICQAGDEPIIRPCQCEGTMAYAHPYCLAEWIASRGELSCEVCGTPYTLQVAVENVPPLASLLGLQLAGKLLVAWPFRRLCNMLCTPLQVLLCCLVVLCASATMWYGCLAHVMLPYRAPTDFPLLVDFSYAIGVFMAVVPIALLWAFEQFRVWAFLHEDDVVGLPPETPIVTHVMPAVDDVATSALNEAFTRGRAESPSAARDRYLAVAEMHMSKDTTLQLLKAKVRASRGPAQGLSSWNFGPAWYAAKVLLVHMIGVGAVVLGHVTLSALKLLCHGATAWCSSLLPPAHPSLHLQAASAVTSAVVPSYVYWATASVVGLMEWPLIMRTAARWRKVIDVGLSRSLFLCSLFIRSVASLLALFLSWAVVIPVVAYVCLFPFFAEGDLAVLMERRDAWQVLRAERLLPLRCDAPTRVTTSAAKPLVQPLNVARALVTVIPDVWQGRCPRLFDAATCGVAASATSAYPSWASLTEFVWYVAGVLMRISTFSTWLTLLGSLQTTLLWLLTGAFVLLSPYTLLAQDLAENEFFFALLRLHGGAFWRTLLEVPLLVAFYSATVGFGAFASLHRVCPEMFPKSLTYLSFYSPEKQDIHFHFLYCWLGILKRLHTSVRGWLRNWFLYPHHGTPETRQRGSQAVERTAYAVCLVCANVLMGATLEWASARVWFPFLGFTLSLIRVARRGGNLNIAFPELRRGAQNWRMQALLFCFYGVSVDFARVEACTCRRVVRVKPSRLVPLLLQRAVEQKDTTLFFLLSSLADSDGGDVVVCSRDALQRLTTETVKFLATPPRLGVAALLALATPLVVCSQWHLNFVDRVAADYVALPLWFCLLLRWATGALALVVWVFVEGLLLRTSLFHRCLEYAPQLTQGPPSLEAVHAVLLPCAIHGGLVRFAVAALFCLSDGSLLPTYGQMSLLAVLLLIRLAHHPPPLGNADWGRFARFPMDRFVTEWLPTHATPQPPEPTGDAGEQVVRDQGNDSEQLREGTRTPYEPQPPPARRASVAKLPSTMTRLHARFARWVASQTATDIVLVAYAQPPAPQAATP
ncbi:hypothetical protein LSCM1_01305 [Leishmania martiniquensis]|uniref:RING-CH-type domain-containing protein n=1 Tax=Leishmania martiniquensis TaxID=1580590 RepID=A0A836KFX1_9TRYP|nr:hypothetical protein LSCM1_01305 [Leishmania martiniquensis]